MPTPAELDDLFRPYELRTVARCEVRIFNAIYFSLNLENYHADQVRVGYDIHDPSQVWIRDLEGRFITHADLNGNKRDYFPMSVVEAAKEKRMQGKLKRLETHKQTALEEYYGQPLIECTELTPTQQAIHNDLVCDFISPQELASTEPETREERFKEALALEEALERGEDIGQENMRKLATYKKSPEYTSQSYMYETLGNEFLMHA